MSPATGAGGLLRRAREDREETLSEVSQATRISEQYLAALEADAPIEEFPAPAYARAFVRAYARHVGLEEDEVVAVFSSTHRATDPPPQPVLPIEEPSPKRRIAFPTPMAIRPPLWTRSRIPHSRTAARPWYRIRPPRLRSRGRIRTLTGRAVPVAVTSAALSNQRRRRLPLWVWLLGAGAGLATIAYLLSSDVLSLGSDVHPTPRPTPVASPLVELPRGGRTIFPAFRVVAFYGAPRTEDLGVLGIGPGDAARRLADQALKYDRPSRPILPAFELIATVAARHPGDDGLYRNRQGEELIGGYLDAARASRMLFILDIQPGRADFMEEVKVYERFLREPDVGLALDPEWHVGPGQVPGDRVGSIDAKTVNQVGTYLAKLVRRYQLPQKLFVIHQFTEDMVVGKGRIKTWPELAATFDVDGFGDRPNKLSKYRAFTRGYEQRFFHGIKLYYEKDTRLLTPKAVLKLDPQPDLVIYQ